MLKLKEPYNQLSLKDENSIDFICKSFNRTDINIIEIGCWLGNSTSILAKYGSVICIDTFMGVKGVQQLVDYAKNTDVYFDFINNMRELGLELKITTFCMESNEAHKFLKDNSYDLIFIDGDHRYEQVKNDIENYLPKLKDNGIICGHDYEIGFDLDLNSLTELDLNKDMSRGFHCGVVKAVNEKLKNIHLLDDRIWYSYV